MKFITDPIVKSAQDVLAVSRRLLDDGVGYLRTSVGSVPLFAGTKAYIADEGFGADETHYFLIPFRVVEESYAIATRRILPDGVGPANGLPKRRVFHLPAGVSESALKALLEKQIATREYSRANETSSIADRMDEIAAEIDSKSNFVTGGLLLIGGAVAVANPIVGAGIAAKALIPGVGGTLSKLGAKALADALRDRRATQAEKSAQQTAAKEVERLKPVLHSNQLLSILERAVSTDDPDHDPAESNVVAETAADVRVVSITAEAILGVYSDLLESRPAKLHHANVHDLDRRWLVGLRELVP